MQQGTTVKTMAYGKKDDFLASMQTVLYFKCMEKREMSQFQNFIHTKYEAINFFHISLILRNITPFKLSD